MDRRLTPFKYRLASLLKVDQFEGNLLGIELRRARQVVEERKRLHAEVLKRIELAEGEMRSLHEIDQSIPLERRRVVADYLRQQYEVALQRAADSTKAEQLFDQIMAQRQAKQQRIRALEEHRGREQSDHNARESRSSLREADDLWLITRSKRG